MRGTGRRLFSARLAAAVQLFAAVACAGGLIRVEPERRREAVAEMRVVYPGEGTVLTFRGATFVVKDGGGQSVLEYLLMPGSVGMGAYALLESDELLYVREGDVTLSYGGQKDVLGAGTTVIVPRGLPHAYSNTSGIAQALLVFSNDGPEQFLGEAAALFARDPAAATGEAVQILARRHGVRLTDAMEVSLARPLIRRPSEGREVELWPHVFVVKAGSRDTRGAMAVVEARTDGDGDLPPLWRLRHTDALLYVMEGELLVKLEDRLVHLPPGTVAFIPRGTLHALTSNGRLRTHTYALYTPGGFEGFFDEMANFKEHWMLGPIPPGVLAPIERAYGVEIAREEESDEGQAP